LLVLGCEDKIMLALFDDAKFKEEDKDIEFSEMTT